MKRYHITSVLAVLAIAALTFATSKTASAGSVMLLGTGSGALQHNGTTKIDILDPNGDDTVDTAEWGTHPTNVGDPTSNSGYNMTTPNEHWGRVFDNSTGTKVCCSFNAGITSITVDSSTRQYLLTGYTISTANDDHGRQPDGWRVFGSNDGFATAGDLLDTVVRTDFQGGAGFTANQQVGEVTLAAPTAPYSSFRILFDDTDSPPAFQISEIELFGTEFIGSAPTLYFVEGGLLLLGVALLGCHLTRRLRG